MIRLSNIRSNSLTHHAREETDAKTGGRSHVACWEVIVKRLDKLSFDGFAARRGVAAVMFLAPRGEACMEQAIDFAVTSANHTAAAFGFVDAFQDVALCRLFEIRVLPTVLVLRDGGEITRLEGRHAAAKISSAIAAAATMPVCGDRCLR
jgi:hypothetical protein